MNNVQFEEHINGIICGMQAYENEQAMTECMQFPEQIKEGTFEEVTTRARMIRDLKVDQQHHISTAKRIMDQVYSDCGLVCGWIPEGSWVRVANFAVGKLRRRDDHWVMVLTEWDQRAQFVAPTKFEVEHIEQKQLLNFTCRQA
jgi:hypothetical protein